MGQLLDKCSTFSRGSKGFKYTMCTFTIESAWEGDPIATPVSTVGGKEVCLSRTRGPIRKGEVVATTNEAGVGGASILRGEVWIRVD